MRTAFGVELLGQAPADLVEDQANERLGTADVGGRHHQIERGGHGSVDEIGDAPVAGPRHPRHDRIAIEPQERHGRSEEHTSELQSLMRISYAVFCLKKKNSKYSNTQPN